MTKADDKRRQRRIPVELWIEAERDGELYFQRASNLSVGGAYFAQTIPLPVGTVVALRFQLPG
ncbi:MAG: PilZ domain-containing protein, partial [Myxococcaceae bacterium]